MVNVLNTFRARKRFALSLALLTAISFVARLAPAQKPLAPATIAEDDPTAVRYGEAISTRYRVGAKITAKGSSVQDIYTMVAVPLDCPEQEVHVVSEDISPQVGNVEYRTLPLDKRAEPAARQMLISIPQLASGQEAQALITYEVVTKTILPPLETATLRIPKKVDREIKPFLTASPFFNVDHRKIRDALRAALAAAEKGEHPAATDEKGSEGKQAAAISPSTDNASAEAPTAATKKDAAVKPASSSQESKAEKLEKNEFKTGDEPSSGSTPAGDGKLNDWQRVEAIYDYVQDKVEYEAGAPDKSALQTLDDCKADCHGIAALFVAMCRTANVPARMVWVDGHQYAEFYLENAQGKGHWYPVQSAGTRAFGEMPVPKVILQKGDKFTVPERRREQLRYASDYTTLKAESGNKPTVKYVREQL
jgi:hypothetical protein